MCISYIEALVLKDISAGEAEVFINCQPLNVYINGSQTGGEEAVMNALDLFVEKGFVEVKVITGLKQVYAITDDGKQALENAFSEISGSGVG